MRRLGFPPNCPHPLYRALANPNNCNSIGSPRRRPPPFYELDQLVTAGQEYSGQSEQRQTVVEERNQLHHHHPASESMFDSGFQKAALVWSPAPDAHAKSGGGGGGGGGLSSGSSSVRPVSPSSGLVHWMSMMADHAHHVGVPTHNSPHDVHYMWNGVETKMNTSDQHGGSLQKGPGSTLDENRGGGGGGGLESGQLHGIYGNHSNRANNNSTSNSPPVSSSSSGSMLVVPQPISATKGGGPQGPLNSPNTPTTANGTGRKYQCKMCPQIFGSKADLQLHTQIHMREAKPYKCSQCSKAFANSSYLSQHTRIHLGIKPYRCEICQRKFTQLSHLQQHIRTHTGDKPYKCRHPGCNKAFSQLSNLQSHSRCHQTDKPYKCNSCYKCFSDEGSLLEHIPKHKESKHLKTHICQYCGKSYTQETYLAKHMQKHADRMDKRAAHAAAVLAASAPPPTSNRGGPNNQASHNAPANDGRISSEGFWGAKPPSSSTPDMTDLRIPHLGNQGNHGGGHVTSDAFLQQGVSEHHHSRLQLNSRSEMDQHHRQSAGPHMGRGGGDHNNEMGGGGNHLSPNQVTGNYDASGGGMNSGGSGSGNVNVGVKTSSAFTPIQTMLPNLPITSSSQLTMPGSSRSYFPYEPISFPKAPQGGTAEPPKSTHASFPNHLISLHHIKNYASMPGVVGGPGEHPISLKDKSNQQQQQQQQQQ